MEVRRVAVADAGKWRAAQESVTSEWRARLDAEVDRVSKDAAEVAQRRCWRHGYRLRDGAVLVWASIEKPMLSRSRTTVTLAGGWRRFFNMYEVSPIRASWSERRGPDRACIRFLCRLAAATTTGS
jgi:hypothetical protein